MSTHDDREWPMSDSAIDRLRARVDRAEARQTGTDDAPPSARPDAPTTGGALPPGFGPKTVQGPGWGQTDRFIYRRRR